MHKRIVWIALFAGVFLGGCSNLSKRSGHGSRSRSRADAGAPAVPATDPLPDRGGIASLRPGGEASVKGMLAGQVFDNFERPVSKASIQLIEVREGGQTPAPLEVWANEKGFFTIPGLDSGAAYQLIARVKDGERMMAGTLYVRAPNPRLVIRISEDYVSPATPKPPMPSAVPPEKPKAEEKKPQEKKPQESRPETKPSASLDGPVPSRTPVPLPPSDPGSGGESSGETPAMRTPRPDLRIRTPALSIPSIPVRDTGVRQDQPAELPPVKLAPASYTSAPLPVPSCIMLTSRQIDNFALQDVEGKPWEFRRDRRGRLFLLDFWHTRCGPCLRSISHLNELHQAYGSRGLEVIGIACEQAEAFDMRVRQVQAARSRFDMRYRILLAGQQGALKPCPLSTQLGIAAYPTLKLIDERGNIVWESMGMGDRQLYELKMEIERRLPLRR